MKTIRQRYELEREIGYGASSSVWSARDIRLRRKVAVKLMRAEGREQWFDRFESEALTTAQLRGPNVVQVFDVGIEDDVPFLVTELLEGESLERRLQRQGHFSLRLAAAIVGDIARGLTVIHTAGVVHRDVKPANVFMAREGHREILKLLDFGIAVPVAIPGKLSAATEPLAGTASATRKRPPSLPSQTAPRASPADCSGLNAIALFSWVATERRDRSPTSHRR